MGKQVRSSRGNTAGSVDSKGTSRWLYLALGLFLAVLLAIGARLILNAGAGAATSHALDSHKLIAHSGPDRGKMTGAVDHRAVQPPAVGQTAFTLPASPREFDLKAEQQQLLQAVEQLLTAYPRSAMARHVAGITFSELLQTEKAKDYFQRSLELDANVPQVYVDYAALLLKTGEHEQVVELLQDIADTPSATADVLAKLGKAYAELGQLDTAVTTWRKGTHLFPADATLHLGLAQALLQSQDYAGAEDHARQAVALGLSDNAAYTTLASALVRLGEREKALKIRSKLSTLPQQAEAKDEQYLASFKEFASHTYTMLASVHRGNGQNAAAEQKLIEALEITPESVSSLLALADLLHQQWRMSDAVVVYQKLIRIQPENTFNYNNLASLAMTIGDLAVADDALKRAIEFDPTGNATLRYADYLVRTGRPAEAIEWAKLAVKQLGNADSYLVCLAAQQSIGDLAGAAITLQQGRSVWPSDPRLMTLQR